MTDIIDSICKHCMRLVINEGGVWIDPDAFGDDEVWRATCDEHDTLTAEHEPTMLSHSFVVTVVAPSREAADIVMGARLAHDEQIDPAAGGPFDYTITWR